MTFSNEELEEYKERKALESLEKISKSLECACSSLEYGAAHNKSCPVTIARDTLKEIRET